MRCRWEFGLKHLLGAFRGWAYQDFTAGAITTTSVTLSDNENGTYPYVFNSDKIVNSTAVIVRASDPTKKAYTGTTKLFSSKVSVSAHTGTSVTLSGVPHSTWGGLRIYFFYQYDYGMPVGYTIPSRSVAEGVLSELQDLLISEEEIGDGSKDAVFSSIENTPIGASTPSTGKFTSITVDSLTDGTATLTGGDLSGIGALTATTFTDGTATLTGGVLTGATGHDSFSDFVAAEHYDWTDETHAFLTTNSGRFDGGVGVGVDPDALNMLNIYKDSANYAGIRINNVGAGDSIISFYDTTLKWVMGVDGDGSFKIDQSVAVGGFTGTQDFVLDSSGNLTISGDITAGGSMSADDFDGIQPSSEADGFIITGGTTPRNLVVSGGDWTLDHQPLDWTQASVGTIDATNIEDKFLRNDGNDVTTGTLTASGLFTDNSLSRTGDADTQIYFDDDAFYFIAGNVEMMRFTERAIGIDDIAINEAGANLDFRVESQTNTKLLFCDASTSRVGINTATPLVAFHVTGETRISGLAGGGDRYVYVDNDGQLTAGAGYP